MDSNKIREHSADAIFDQTVGFGFSRCQCGGGGGGGNWTRSQLVPVKSEKVKRLLFFNRIAIKFFSYSNYKREKTKLKTLLFNRKKSYFYEKSLL